MTQVLSPITRPLPLVAVTTGLAAAWANGWGRRPRCGPDPGRRPRVRVDPPPDLPLDRGEEPGCQGAGIGRQHRCRRAGGARPPPSLLPPGRGEVGRGLPRPPATDHWPPATGHLVRGGVTRPRNPVWDPPDRLRGAAPTRRGEFDGGSGSPPAPGPRHESPRPAPRGQAFASCLRQTANRRR